MIDTRLILLFSLMAATCHADDVVPLGLTTIPELINHLPVEQQALLSEYPVHFDQVAAFYENGSMEGHVFIDGREAASEDWTVIKEYEGIVKHLGWNSFRVESGNRPLLIANPDEWYAFEKNPKTDIFFLRANGRSNRSTIDQYAATYAYFLAAPFSSVLRRAICSHGSNIRPYRATTELDPNGDEIVQVTCHGTDGKVPTLFVERFRRIQHWVVAERLCALVDASTKSYTVSGRTTCRYGDNPSEVPILKEVCQYENYAVSFRANAINPLEEFQPANDEATSLKRNRAVIERIISEPPQKSEFDAAPTIRELGGVGNPQKSGFLSILLLVNGFFLFLLAISLLRRKRSEQNSSGKINHVI